MAKNDVFEIEDDRLDLVEKNILTSVFGAEVAREVLMDISENPEEEFDEELQEFIEDAPALDEI